MKTSPPTSAKFDQFVDLLHVALEQLQEDDQPHSDIGQLLDGAASKAAKSLLPLHYRQQHGIFFSGHEIATQAAAHLRRDLSSGGTVFDPACGAGDLLLAAAWHMPLLCTQVETIQAWTEAIGGCDIHREFVLAARIRLLLLVRMRHSARGDEPIAITLKPWMFAGIRCADYFSADKIDQKYTCVIANPPFGDTAAPNNCAWSSGKTQMAAVFLDTILTRADVGQHIVAVLPDVLRSGTRYGRWRQRVANASTSIAVLPYGRFDEQTDVDVFLLHMRVGKEDDAIQRWPALEATLEAADSCTRLKDNYDIRIGPVVPHRHAKRGGWVPYLCVKTAEPFSEIVAVKKRRFKGRLFSPPFLVIRRTSNPADEHRIIPTLVTGKEAIAVENHLIVIFPKSGGIQACRRLYSCLITESTRLWIDNAIRCRHLTKQVLLELPTGNI
jgi:hypothetical protein